MCLNETCSRVRINKHMSDSFPTQYGLKQGNASSPLLFNFGLEYAIWKVQGKPGGTEIEWDASTCD
jgi:hypothetical protein